MKEATTILVILAATASLLGVPSSLRAESNVGEPGEFFQFTSDFDPQAAGTKYEGTMSIAYVFVPDGETCPDSALRIDNMYVVLTLNKGNERKPFNTDFTKTGTAPFCFIGEPDQIKFILDLVRDQVLPHFYPGCFPGACPSFKVKSVSNFLSSGTGAISMDITIAVQ